MSSLDDEADFSHLQDILGQVPMVRSYTHITLCFPLADESSIVSALNTLKTGSARLKDAFPWLAGQVIIKGKTDTNSGLAAIKPCGDEISFVENDLRKHPDAPTYSSLQQRKFPMEMLDRHLIAPLSAIPEIFDDVKDAPVRVLEIRANLIRGGILLNMAGNHHFMDMNGLGHIIHLYSKACRDEPFTGIELEFGNCPRRDLIPLFDESYQPGSEVKEVFIDPNTTKKDQDAGVEEPASSAPTSWSYFLFSADSLTVLKTLASTQTRTKYITTNDVLTGLLWKALVKAKSARGPGSGDIRVLRCVDARRYFGLPKEYPGHNVTGTYHCVPGVQDLPLPDIAGMLRQELEQADLVPTVRGMVTLLDRLDDKSPITYTANMKIGRDLLFSSWVQVPTSTSDFGSPLGAPECARRPRFPPLEGLIYFMPKDQDGSIAAAVCLTDDDTEALKCDEYFTRFAEFIG